MTPGAVAGAVRDEAELGGDDDVVAAALDGRADDLLAVERAVDLGGVDVGDAEVERAVDGADRLGVVERSAAGVGAGHGHGAQADAGDIEVCEVCGLHDDAPWGEVQDCHATRRAGGEEGAAGPCTSSPPQDRRVAIYGGDVDNRDEVKDFLRSRRARLTPEQAGLTAYAATGACPGSSAARSPTWPGSASSTTPSSNAATCAGVSDSVLDAWPEPCSSTRPNAPTWPTSPAPPARRPAHASQTHDRSGPTGRAAPARPRSATPCRSSSTTAASTWSPPTPSAAALFAPVFAAPRPVGSPANHARFTFLDDRARDFWLDWDTRCRRRRLPAAHRGRPRPLRPGADRPGRRAQHPQPRNSAPAGPPTTSACTAPAASTSATPSSASSTWTSRCSTCPPTPG